MQNLKILKMMFSFCLVFCAVELIQATTIPMVGAVQKFALSYHNDLRRGEKAANMMEMVWSKELAQEAEDWAKRCNFEHRMEKDRGENLAFNSNPGTAHERIKSAMDAWFDEKKLHDWGAFRCSSSCHYTQLVWAKTTEVGCALEKCDSLSAFGGMVDDGYFYVCFYNPAGNSDTEVYKKGTPCSVCPMGTKCDKGLCAGHDGGKYARLWRKRFTFSINV